MCKYKNPICHTCHMFKYKILYRNVTCANTKILYWNVTCANTKILYWNVTCANIKSDIVTFANTKILYWNVKCANIESDIVTCANTKILYWNVTCANIESDIEMSHVQIQKSHMSHMSHAIRHLLRYLVAYNLSRLHTVNMSSAICQLVMNTFVSAQPLRSQQGCWLCTNSLVRIWEGHMIWYLDTWWKRIIIISFCFQNKVYSV